MTRFDVVDDAHLWLGTNYVHQARYREVGTDCRGIIGGIARDRGTPDGLAWEVDRTAHNYGRLPQPRRLLEMCARYLDPISAREATLGDVVLMRFTTDPQHFAIIVAVDPPYIIHASNSARMVVKHRLDDLWRSRIVRAYRYRGLE